MGRKSFWPVLGLFCALLILPYGLAQWNAGQDHIFGGFLLNPLDGNTYLAKMEEGWRGDWWYTLPFTAEKSGGAFLFMFYLLLGHLARVSGLPLLLIFHLARVLAAGYLAFALYEYCVWVFGQNLKWAQRAFVLVLFGSGLGWLLLGLGWIAADLLVAEAYPFLSAYANPHFPLGMALLLQLFMRLACPVQGLAAALRLAGMGLLLAVVMPFGVVVAGVVGGVWLLLEWFTTRKFGWQPYVAVLSLAGPALLYQYLAAQTDPLLSLWNAQNVTPAPPPWDFAAAFSPAIGFAGVALWQLARKSVAWSSALRLQAAWFVAGILLIYFPFALQRRFMFAFFVPVAVLAVVGISNLPGLTQKAARRIYTLVLVLSLVTNGVVLLLAGFAASSRQPAVYFTRDAAAAFAYIRSELPADAVILCDPEVGNLIPGWTGRRVLYGHDFETVNAAAQKQLVQDLLLGQFSAEQTSQLMQKHGVQYVWLRAAQPVIPQYLKSLVPVYQNETVAIYRWQ